MCDDLILMPVLSCKIMQILRYCKIVYYFID